MSYRNTKFPGINPEEIRFVNCTPNGAPNPPTCSAPVLVTTEGTPVFTSSIGDLLMEDVLYPRHTHRLESDGKTVTTFLVYDRCEVKVVGLEIKTDTFCPKNDVAMTTSTDGLRSRP